VEVVDFKSILSNGVTITSSGTTGTPKEIFRTPENLKACNAVAIDAQKLTSKSRVLTVTRMTHAGGLLTQSLPAYTLGAELKIQQFNPYTFLKDFQSYTHTFLTPAHMKALVNTKGFKDSNLAGKFVLGGSDPVDWDLIYKFVYQGATVMPNWGMSEIGPITINTTFNDLVQVLHYRHVLKGEFILGDCVYCDIKIVDNELYVRGSICYQEGWLATGDLVESIGKLFSYKGRKNSCNHSN